MNESLYSQEKEVLRKRLADEKKILVKLEGYYEDALEEIENHIAQLLGRQDANLPNVINHVEYQRMIKDQVQSSLDKLHSHEYESIEEYLQESYTDAFVGTMYSLHAQDIPIIVPINQALVIKAISIDTKLKDTLYKSLGKDMTSLKKTITSEITRGIASGMLYSDIQRNLSNATRMPLSRARLIVRTEAGRVQEEATMEAADQAKAKGADVVKQWSAILDGVTRYNHRLLDHQVRELEEYFEVSGKKAKQPHGFGDPAEDCNCRCTTLIRARAALDADELAEMQKRASFHGLLVKDSKAFGHAKVKDFSDFKKKYLKATEPLKKQGKNGIIELKKDPFYDGLSSEEIASRYKKTDGSNLLDKSFFDLRIETQRETVRGYDKAIGMYGNIPPQRIKTGKVGKNVFARYDLDYKVITINSNDVIEQGEAYVTMIHEMTHHAENLKLFNSKSIVRSAFKSLGLRSNSNQAKSLQIKTVGLLNREQWENTMEVVAYAIERQLTGRANPLTEAIYSVMKEKGVIK